MTATFATFDLEEPEQEHQVREQGPSRVRKVMKETRVAPNAQANTEEESTANPGHIEPYQRKRFMKAPLRHGRFKTKPAVQTKDAEGGPDPVVPLAPR